MFLFFKGFTGWVVFCQTMLLFGTETKQNEVFFFDSFLIFFL